MLHFASEFLNLLSGPRELFCSLRERFFRDSRDSLSQLVNIVPRIFELASYDEATFFRIFSVDCRKGREQRFIGIASKDTLPDVVQLKSSRKSGIENLQRRLYERTHAYLHLTGTGWELLSSSNPVRRIVLEEMLYLTRMVGCQQTIAPGKWLQ